MDRFLVIKAKWSGKTERILGFKPYTFATINPKTGTITNEWSYDAISSVDVSIDDKSEFTINMLGLKKRTSLKLRHRYRAEVLQALARSRAAFAMERKTKNKAVLAKLTPFNAHVESFILSGDDQSVQCELLPCVLEVGVDAVYQTGGSSDRFPYFELTQIQSLDVAMDDPSVLAIRIADITQVFHIDSPNDIIRAILESAISHDMILPVTKDSSAGILHSKQMHYTSVDPDSVLVLYDVQYPTGQEGVDNGFIVLTDTLIVEQDMTRLTTFVQPLTKIYEITRHKEAADEFDIEFVSGLRRTYYTPHRDAIINHLLESCASRGTLVLLSETRTTAKSRLFLRKMMHGVSLPGEMLWYQVTWLHRLVGSDKSDVEGKTPSILQQFKKKKVVEPEASHPEMVIDFNANVPLSGVSTKLKEDVAQATALLLSEIPHMVLLQRKQNLTDAAAYIQCLYRLVANPFAAKQALEMLARSEYMDAFADILKRNDFHATYATLDIMSRLLNGPDRGQSRKVFLSHNGFLTSLLALFQTQHDNALILGRLCHVLESLLSFNVQNVDPLFNILLNHVSMHYAMLVRTLFHYAPPATVESCICILHHMIHTTVLSFTKLHESTFRQWDARFSMENPERMIKQYHSFLMAQDSVQDLRNQNSPMALRLRYRYRAQFLQQWMHSLTGHFDLAIECLGLDAVKYEGSKMSQIGQVKSAIYVVPSGLVVITLNNKRSMYDFGLLQENLVGYMAEDPCGLVFSINGRHRIVYSFERSEIFDRMKALAGQLGIFLENDGLYLNNEIRTSKPTVEDLGEAFLTSFNVSRVDLSTDLRKPKRLAMTSTSLVECDEHGSNVRTWNFAQVHQITRLQHHEERFEIQFNSGKSMWYDSEDRDVILTTLLDACMHDKHGQTVSNAHEMCIGMHIAPTSLITSLLPRCILRSPDEHAFYFGSDGMGMYYLSKISLSRDTFVEAVEEFNSNCNVSRDTQLHFTSDPTWMPQVCKEMADTFDEVDLDNSQLDTADQVSQRLYHRLERFPTATELDIHARNRKGNYPSETSRDMHLLAHLLLHPFALPDLIWYPTTSQELKYALEEALLDHEEMVSSTYFTLAKEIKVDTYYLRILMDNVHDGVVLQSERIEQRHRNSSFGDVDMDFRSHFAEIVAHSVVGIASNPKRFFDLCYQRWLQELPFSCNARGPAFPQDIGTASVVGLRDNAEIWCLQLMVATYKAYSIGIIEAEKVAFVVRMLRGETRASIIEELLAWSVKSLKQLQHLEANKSNPFAYFNFFKKGDGLEFGETNIDTVQDDFHGEVYWYVMRDNDLNSISGPHPESILHAICSTKGSDWSKMLLSMYNELAPEDRDWRPLLRVPRIRWRLFVQSPFHVNVCIYTTSLVQSLVEAEIDRTQAGLKLLPVPAGKRYLSDPFSLACVVQLLLCEEADIVESAISILSRLIAYNDATATNLYRCGAIWFMFASASRVSFYEHAKVLEQTHRRQSEHSAKKSILLGFLPEALVRILDLEGPAAFADIFTFRAVDRRVLWTEDMRDHLHDMLQEHLAPFICRLHQDSTALFEYSPMPPVIYSQLRDDIFVYNMHLSRLFPEDDEPAMASSHAETQPDDFDDDEFNDLDNQDEGNEAPIEAINSSRGRVIDEVDDPLAFMRAVHSTWRQEIAVAEGRMAKDIARQVLQIDPSELQQEQDNAFLRARYRAVCLSENIDVEKLNEAFIVLSCVPDSTCELDKLPHKTLSLLLRTQLLFYDTFPSSFQSIPYDAYDLLLKLLGQFDFRVDIENPEYSIEHDAQAMELLSLTMELLLATMISSPWNVEQMLRAKGLSTIIEIADLCRKSQTGWVSEQDSHFDYIGGLSFRVLLAVANTDVGRDELAFEHQNSAKKESIRPVVAIVSELIRQDLGNMNMTILALDILSLMARQETSQECILSSTLVFWHALQHIIVFGNQPAKKQLVWAALRCVRVLAGLDGDSKSRPDVQMALTKLIPMWTPALLMTEHVDTIISSVFSELRVPQYIWFEDMRLEVKAYLDTLLEFQVPTRSFEAIASQFSFDALEGEPVVGGIFLQVYKEGPVRSLPAAVAIEFCELLLVFLYEHALPIRPRYHETLLALECFALLTETSPVEVQQSCLQSFSEPPLLHALGLFMTMGMPKSNGSFDVDAVQRRDIAITCMQALARNCDASVLNPLKTFCKDILAMAELQAGENDSALQCLRELCEASDDICIHVLETKVWLELLSMTIQAKHYVTEDAHVAAETLCAPAAEVWFTLLNGSDDVRSIALTQLKYFLPYALVHSLAEDPDIFFDDFEESAHDAELIWNDDIRSAVRMHLDEVLSKADPTFPEDQMDFSAWDSGTIVGDLYLDLFLQNPEATRLRHPDHIVNQLLMVWRQEMASIIPLAAQSMIDAPYTLPYLVEQQIGNAALLNKLTNALVFIWREYVDVKASMEENGLCEELLNVLKHCQAERAIGFPQTCVLRLIQIFASNNHFDSTDCLHSLFAPLARKHQDPTLVLDITRTIIEKHLGKPKRQQTYSALQLVRELDVLQVIMGYAEGSADMANVRRPVECRASASSIIRMLQPLEDPEVSNNPAKGPTTPRVGGVMLNMRASIGAPPLGTTQRQPIGSGRRRASMPELHPVSVPQQTHVVLPERPKPTPLIIPQNQVVPRVRTPVNHPYGRFRSDMPSRLRKTISEVSIDTHSVSVDSFIAPLPPPHFAAPDSANHVTDIFGSEPFSNSTSFHNHGLYSDISEESSEFEVDDPSEANFDTNEEEHEE
ncbi:unnamed protein product, partial [Aphanomyces euteiches]